MRQMSGVHVGGMEAPFRSVEQIQAEVAALPGLSLTVMMEGARVSHTRQPQPVPLLTKMK